VWQELRAELHPRGLEIVTVALDSGGADAARKWIEAARAVDSPGGTPVDSPGGTPVDSPGGTPHPALIDRAHVCDELFGIVNVPSGVWIDERGMIVRPPETAYPRRPAFLDREIPADATPRLREAMEANRRLRIDAERYVAALRDWVANGDVSRYALAPDEVVGRSRSRPMEHSTAAAHFELGLELQRRGDAERAAGHFREAHRLQPENWTYKRQAWALAGNDRDRLYATDWLAEVKKIGAENYYDPFDD